MNSILIIEDDTGLQKILTMGISRHSYQVYSAEDGREGYDKIKEIKPDLVLLDLMLPMLPGIEILEKLHEDPILRKTKIIVMTAYGDPEGVLEKTVLKLGAEAYIEKPFPLKEVVELIKDTLRPKSRTK